MNATVLYLFAAALAAAAVVRLRLPALVGFLVAGFALVATGAPELPWLAAAGDIGVTLLLFSIGLKLDLPLLVRKEVAGVGAIHFVGGVVVMTAVLSVLGLLGLPLLHGLELSDAALIGFALSFSSTVLVVKILEENRRTGSFFGRVAVGILILQDIIAVAFIAISEQRVPSPWALLLLLLIPARPLIRAAAARLISPETTLLLGLALAPGPGYLLFDALGVKGDLGALVMGALLARSPSAKPMAYRIAPVKDLLLVAFLLAIGLTGIPDLQQVALALILVALLPVKGWAYAWLLGKAGLDRRSMGKAGLLLANYSEFALIVVAVVVQKGWLSQDWTIAMATAVALSFVAASVVSGVPRLAEGWHDRMPAGPPPHKLHPECAPVDATTVDVVVVGLGRVGAAALRQLHADGWRALGLDQDRARVRDLAEEGMRTAEMEASDPDGWLRVHGIESTRYVLLALPTGDGAVEAIDGLRGAGFAGRTAAAVRQPEDLALLEGRGVRKVMELHEAAGAELADVVRNSSE